jgi:alkylhydroperoxidase/carboxymuconolactone decarboxylase family protein YurZ
MTTSLLPRLCAGVVLGRWDTVRDVRRRAGPGEPDRAWREAVLQTHLFAGFPRLVEAYDVLREVGGLGTPEPGEAAAEPDRPERGRELFDRIYGDVAGAVRASLAEHHPDFARWVEGHAYGRVLARSGLDPARRELLAVACLAALGQDRQLLSHARGALRCGASGGELDGVLDAVADLLEPGGLKRARRIVSRVRREHEAL